MSERENKNQIFRQGGQEPAQSGMPSISAVERMRQEFGVVAVPAEIVRLPSGGKIYNPANPACAGSVEIKAMTTREEDILTSRAFIKKGTVITELIKSCVTDKTIDVDELVSGDRNALMVAIRITGYGSDYEVNITCPACNKPNDKTFDLTRLLLKPIGLEPVSPGLNEFACELPVSKAKATFKLLTAKDEEELVRTQENRKRVLGPGGKDTIVTDQIKAALQSVNGNRDGSSLGFFVDNMPGRDSLAIRDAMAKARPDVDMTQPFECDHCDHKEDMSVPISVSFFWPKVGE